MAQSAVNWHNSHTHMECTHLLAHLNQHSYKLQPHCAKCQLSYYFSVHAASFHVSVIHQTLTWNTGSLLCVCDHSCACIYTHRGWAHQQRVSRTFLTQKNSQIFLVLLTGFKPQTFGSRVRRSTNWATPSPNLEGRGTCIVWLWLTCSIIG